MTAIGGLQAFRSTGLKATATDVKAAVRGRVRSIHVSNLDAAAAWVTFWDAAGQASVTVGTTTPLATFHVGASLDKDVLLPEDGLGFNLGCVAAVTTTDGGAVAPTNGCAVTILYE